jgi:hypothetical protein
MTSENSALSATTAHCRWVSSMLCPCLTPSFILGTRHNHPVLLGPVPDKHSLLSSQVNSAGRKTDWTHLLSLVSEIWMNTLDSSATNHSCPSLFFVDSLFLWLTFVLAKWIWLLIRTDSYIISSSPSWPLQFREHAVQKLICPSLNPSLPKTRPLIHYGPVLGSSPLSLVSIGIFVSFWLCA